MAPTEEVTGAGSSPALFNGALETGVRTVVVLDAAYPHTFDITKLTWCDHLVVHTADINGPPSLHPDIPQRTGELLIRRRLVEDGVNLMRRLHMIDATADTDGIRYQASEEASAFVEALQSEYAQSLKKRATWLVGYLQALTDDALTKLITERIGRWAVEFQGDVSNTTDRAS
ncbi:MAG: ABC-three component system middle component 2 [Nitrobacter sp.]|jgi:hypothetical protein